jgi:hypothetical protein
MKVLIACEFSGIIRECFKAKGHIAMSCDFRETEIKGWHYQGDVKDVLDLGWDLMIAHPDCTYITNSGVCHLWDKSTINDTPVANIDRWNKLSDATDFFKLLMNCNIPKICIENPIPHKYAIEQIGSTYTQLIQPYMFGHPEQKATCLWLKNLPKLQETNNVKEYMLTLPKKDRQRIHYMSPGKDRAKERARSFIGIGEAMADQWG